MTLLQETMRSPHSLLPYCKLRQGTLCRVQGKKGQFLLELFCMLPFESLIKGHVRHGSNQIINLTRRNNIITRILQQAYTSDTSLLKYYKSPQAGVYLQFLLPSGLCSVKRLVVFLLSRPWMGC